MNKYTILFLAISIFAAYEFYQSYNYIYLYLMINGSFMTAAYALNNGKIILGKDVNGRVNYILMIANLPWLIFTYLVFVIQLLLIREDSSNHISENVWIGRYPIFTNINEFDVILDLTAEFPKCPNFNGTYYCFPNLDGIRLSNYQFPEISEDSKVLIHCAQGHGRSTTYFALMMNDRRKIDINGILRLVKENRRKADVCKSQYQQILSTQQGDAPEPASPAR